MNRDLSKLLDNPFYTMEEFEKDMREETQGKCIICGKMTYNQRRKGIAGHLEYVCDYGESNCMDVWHERNYDLEDNRVFSIKAKQSKKGANGAR